MLLSRTQCQSAAVLAALFVLLLPQVAFAARFQAAEELLITEAGVGNAMLGQTAEEMAASLGDEFDIGEEVRITVDFNGRVVRRDGDVQFRAAMTNESEELTLFIVSNPTYTTAEGVGATTTIAAAEAIYGDATLSWNPDNEGREFVSFANGPSDRIAFRTPGIGGTNVGVYADGQLETTEYEENGAIAAVWVSCVLGTNCPGDAGAADPEPTPTPEPDPEPTPTPAPEPEPTATPEPDPEPTPTPEPAAADSSDDLPRTGSTELVLISTASLLVLLGGAMVVVERRYLCPAWIRR